METLPAKLCQLRQVIGLSQYQIAFFLNVSQPAYSYWETGETQPRWKNVQAIATFYHISPTDLLSTETDALLIQILHNQALKTLSSVGEIS